MNIFALHQDPQIAAQMHCDKHVVKMILESAHMLSTICGEGYKPTHQNHPCTKWARSSRSNFYKTEKAHLLKFTKREDWTK